MSPDAESERTKSELAHLEAAKLFIDKEGPKLLDSIGLRVAHNAEHLGDKPCIHFEGRELNWREFNELTNQFANALIELGVQEGNTVGLMLENRIEYCAAFLAISKIKAVASLINTNLTSAGLAHCLNVCDSSVLLFGEEVSATVESFKEELAEREEFHFMYISDKGSLPVPSWASAMDDYVRSASRSNPPPKPFAPSDLVLYIFTSGTTGMPKAVRISNIRHMGGAMAGWRMALRTNEKHRTYVLLPLYHGTGLTMGLGASIFSGGFIFLKRKFSASQFLEDVRAHDLSVFIYVGELCRYLMALPEREDDSDNPLTIMGGNGLSPENWKPFKKRFGLERICELYSASEANVNFFNALNKDETIGFPSNVVELVEYDIENDEIIRDTSGRCKVVELGQPGLMLSRISEEAAFQGYTDASANEKKIVRNAIEQGDAWFNSGDLLRQIDVGFSAGLPHYQFVDRVGDTFRWKSENVSTMEVAEAMHELPEIEICNVYGVRVPGIEGKAGMAAIKLIEDCGDIDFGRMSEHLKTSLPFYARPVFLRILKKMETTGTFKLIKGNLSGEGFDPEKIEDPLYFFCDKSGGYLPLTQLEFTQICDGTRRL